MPITTARNGGRHSWILATSSDEEVRSAAEAVRLAERAVALTAGRQAEPLDALAAAQAQMGQFDGAIDAAGRAANLATRAGRKDYARQIKVRIQLYRSGKGFRQQPNRRLRPRVENSTPGQ